MNFCVVIPTYNESANIAALIKDINKLGLSLLIVDDGSQDDTVKIAWQNNVQAIVSQSNQGKGASLIRGFSFCLEKGFDAVICMDGDGQHLPSDIPLFLKEAQTSTAAILIGNRMNDTKKMPLVRWVTNKFMSWLISVICRQKIYDSQWGFRLIKAKLLRKLELKYSKYEIESEMLIKASRLGFKIMSIPITTVYRGEKSSINPVVDTLRFIRFIFLEAFK
ncbi:MAG: glycosyltransferase family 2 protein [Candidatus Omnitrophica bacterium]|nr:glycosyltransferase family 2 protein [Candidatus Omnitrophota bacterium]